ncbi:hypothetical protein ACF0A6_03820 [Acinetobacter baumannii]|uniref:hypothetical protein n=1 Tax=Acinetobacter baumannii TaxID=470 RepID=UPI001BD0F8F8|nr:hypothetical protein [Acinetobacter baumannii]MDQ7845055.1 hypothetical protein [Acinetobacter baumannii]HDX6034097.1 hypothetical protein [Acinetobacter baumannii]
MCLHCFAKEIEKSGMGQVVVLEMTKDGLRPAELNPSTDKAATTETKAAANQFFVSNANLAAGPVGGAGVQITDSGVISSLGLLGKATKAEGKISTAGANQALPKHANFVASGGNKIQAVNINTLDQAYTASEKMHRFVVPNLDELLLRTQQSVGVLSGLSVALNNGDENKYSEAEYIKELIKLTALNFMALQERGVALEDVVKQITQTFEDMGAQTLRDEVTNFLKERGFGTDLKAGA